jgi:hypothetical protein
VIAPRQLIFELGQSLTSVLPTRIGTLTMLFKDFRFVQGRGCDLQPVRVPL